MKSDVKTSHEVLNEISMAINSIRYLGCEKQTQFHVHGDSIIDSIGFIEFEFTKNRNPAIAFVYLLTGTSTHYIVAIIQTLARYGIEATMDYFMVSTFENDPEVVVLCTDDAPQALKAEDEEEGPIHLLTYEITEMFGLGTDGAAAYLEELQAYKKAQIMMAN
jgi:hypothetical protein